MLGRRLFSGLILASTLLAHSILCAQSAPVPLVVNESGARAVLGGDSIHLQLPFTTPASSAGRAVVWELSPVGTRSAETAANFMAGARRVRLDLAWPKDAKGKVADDVGWYRIGYRIEAAIGAATNGILSIGQIAPNLLMLRLALPDTVVAGKPFSVRVYAGNPVTGKSFRGVRLVGTLEYDDDSAKDTKKAAKSVPRKVTREATTGLSGEAILSYPIEGAPGDSATLTVKGTLISADGSQATESIDADVQILDRTIINVDTDKPLHKPGETVHLRALVLDYAAHAVANSAMTLTIKDPERKTLLEVPLTTNRFGIASYDWKTGSQIAPWDYDAEVELDGSTSYTDSRTRVISIRRYDLPEFAVSAAMDRGFYLDGQTPAVHIHAEYLFGKPVVAGTVRILRADSRSSWNRSDKKTVDTKDVLQTAALDAHGDAELRLDMKDDFSNLKNDERKRYQDIDFRAMVTDTSTGRTEPRNFKLRITRYPVHIYLNHMGGNDREGDYIVSTSYADGEPAACRVAMDWVDAKSHLTHAASVNTNRYGLARVHLGYPTAPARDPLAPVPSSYERTSFNLRMTARDTEQHTSFQDEEIYAGDAQDAWISVAAALMRPGQNIEATLHGAPGSLIDVDAVTQHGVIDHQQIHMMHAAEPITVLVADGFHGTVTLVPYRMNGDTYRNSYNSFQSGRYKTVLYPEDHELKLKLTGLHSPYTPGAAVDAGINVSAAAGYGVPSALGISVFDSAVELRSETEEDANMRSWSWWRDENNISRVTYGDLSRIDTSQPISDAMQLVADAGLGYYMPTQIRIEQADHDEVRYAYQSMMQKQLKPMGDAILAARPARLPATLDAVRSIVSAAKLDEALLLDPWNTPYRVETSVEWNENEVVSLISAGPDKSFGNGDDFTIEIAHRNAFAIPGEQLTKLLRDAVATGQSLPGTVDSLKQLLRAGGLDLDATFDPYGKPFQYKIAVGKRFYRVQVYRYDTVWPPNGQAYNFALWTSPSIDYFAHTETRMEAALKQWDDAGKTFPTTEAEAHTAFSAGGIDIDGLRDPLGQHLQLRVVQAMRFTRVEKVTSGAGLDAQDKPVTTLYRSIEVVRPANLPEDKDAVENVAQFLHPITQQSGSDAKAEAVNQGTFKGNSGAIGGTITDPTGAVIVDATITVTNVNNGDNVTVKSLANGDYLVPDLDAGIYNVEVVSKGFQRSLIEEVSVSPVALTSINVTLSVGGETATVTVTDAPPYLETTDATLGGTVPGFARTANKPGGTGDEATFTPRLRHVFEETAYWVPSLETGANGRASLHFNLPDSLTTWKLHALASTVDGRIGVLDQSFKTFQPFFVDLDVPQVLTVGDKISLPVNLRNYTTHSVTLPVTANSAEWMTLLAAPKIEATVAANGSTPLVFGLSAKSAVEAGPLRISAANAHEGDAVERVVRVHPDGEPRAVTAAGLVNQRSTTLVLDLPADAIPGSVHAELMLYPNLGAHVLHAMKAVLERPYGCGEQAISSTYPSLLYLKLLKAGNTKAAADDPVAVEAQTNLQLGYDRLEDYFDTSGGLTYWGGEDHTPDPALTAYGVEFLDEATPFIAVDHTHIDHALKWLLANQKTDGSWKPRYGETNAQLNLYIAESLAQNLASDPSLKNSSSAFRDQVSHAVAQAIAWAANSVAAVHAPYANALRLRIAELTHGDAADVAHLGDELASSAIHDRDGVHWTSLRASPFYGWGRAGDLETTAFVLRALRDADPSAAQSALIRDALLYLLRNQDCYGIWYSGQATVRVLQALLPLAIEQTKADPHAQTLQLAINGVLLDASDAELLRADPKILTAPRSLDLTQMLKPGHNELIFTQPVDESIASVETTASFYVPWQGDAVESKTQTGNDAGLDYSYRCNATGAQVGKPIDCTVEARRFGSPSYGMLLAEVGLPPGTDVDREALARLLDDGTISRYELQPDRIVFYLWSPQTEGSHFSFRFTPRYAIHAKAAPATLSDYYNSDLKVVLPPQIFTVTESSHK